MTLRVIKFNIYLEYCALLNGYNSVKDDVSDNYFEMLNSIKYPERKTGIEIHLCKKKSPNKCLRI